MTETKRSDSQLDRLEGKVDQVLDRLTRMEERQNSHGAKLDSHDLTLADHGQRLREVELKHAVVAATGKQQGQSFAGRWAALGAIGLVLLGTLGPVLVKLVAYIAEVAS